MQTKLDLGQGSMFMLMDESAVCFLTVLFPGNQQCHDRYTAFGGDQTGHMSDHSCSFGGFFFVQIQSGNIILYQLLTLSCVAVCCGVSRSAERALDLVQLESSVWLQREWEKAHVCGKNPLAIQGRVFVVVRISNYCCAKCEEKPPLVASSGIRHRIFLVSFSSCSTCFFLLYLKTEVSPCSPSTVDQSTTVDLMYYS